MRTKEEIQSEIDTLSILESEGHLDARICIDKVSKLKIEIKTSKSIAACAPNIIHARLCLELVNLSRKNRGTKGKDVQGWIELLNAIEIIETIYPETASS